MVLFDVHAHLSSERFADDLEQVLVNAKEAGVSTIISNGLNPEDNLQVLKLSQRFPIIKPAVGFYPVDTVLRSMRAAGVDYPSRDPDYSAEEGIASVAALAEQAVAIGEIGLDGYWVPEEFWEEQERVFRQLIAIALEHDKAIIIHSRKRERRCLEILLEMGVKKADFHCFGGKVKLAREIADAGYYLSIPANSRRSESFKRMLETIPRTQLLLETDCPYLSPISGERNEPRHVMETAKFAAELWGCAISEVEAQLGHNFEKLFAFAP